VKHVLWVLIAILLGNVVLFPQSYKDESMSLFFAGQNAYNQGNYVDAEQYLSRALQLDPDLEAKTPNAKFMLGVSAFKNQNYSIAKVNLSLYRDNPIAVDLLNKISDIEGKMGTGFYYFTPIQNTAPVPETTPLSTMSQTNSAGQKSLSIPMIVGIVFAVTLSLSLLMELKFAVFSRLAVRLVLAKNAIPVTVSPSHPETSQISVSSKNDEAELLLLTDTPFEEKIDIQKMASAEIEDIARFFTENPEIDVEKRATGDVALTEEEIAQIAKNEILQAAKSEATAGETVKDAAAGADTIFDELDVSKVIQLAQKMISEAQSAHPQKAEEAIEWKSAEAFSEDKRKNIDYFEDVDEVEEEDLQRFLDLFFARETQAQELSPRY